MPERDAGSMRSDSRRRQSCFAESPASMSMRVEPHSRMVELPAEPEPRTANFMCAGVVTRRVRQSKRVGLKISPCASLTPRSAEDEKRGHQEHRK